MKKLLIIFLFISLTVQAQMKITNHVGEFAGGKQILYRYYETPTPSPYCLIFLHGIGEKGPLDGTLLPRIAKYGYAKYAQAGKVFDFNIVAVQTNDGSFEETMKVLPGYIKEKYDAKVIIVTGLSFGGYGAYLAKYHDKDNLIYAIAPICGAGSKYSILQWPEMRCWHFHGDKDSTVRLSTARNFINSYNASHTSQIRLTVYPGVAHNAWDKAYNITPGQDELLQQINAWFKEADSPEQPDSEAAELAQLKDDMCTYIKLIDSLLIVMKGKIKK